MNLQQHPLSAAFPSMPEVELEALAEDIKKHGQRDHGVLYEGMVLDGWHRYLACQLAGVKFAARDFDGDDPVPFVLGKNLHRRHMTASQRAACIVAATNWRGRGFKSVAATGLSAKALAEKAEVSVSTIEKAKAAERAGLGNAVRSGEVTVERAAEIAKLPPSKREKALKEPKEAKPKVVKAHRDVEKLYEACKAELVETKDKLSELADVARELNEKLEAYETTELDAQQKLISELQLKVRRKDAEIDRLRLQVRDANNKNNELIRTVKRLQKHG